MNFLNCFVLIVILIQSLLSNFVLSNLNEIKKIAILNGILANVNAWDKFKNIKVKYGNRKNLKILTVDNIFDNIDNNINIHQNNTQLLSSTYLHVNSSNHQKKVELIFKLVKCKCWEMIKLCNRILLYMNKGYKMIYDEEITRQDRTMTLQMKDLLLRKIDEYKELVHYLYNIALFFKSLFPEGNENVNSTDAFFSKLRSVVNMPIPPEDTSFSRNLKNTLNDSFNKIFYYSKHLCSYTNSIKLMPSYKQKYKDYKSANEEYNDSFAEYISYHFDFHVKETYDLFRI
ncbi:uncharacterized protein LOC126895635 [Daktulosphaira vitifoliae]|uniref:uncharacterized protein LOC126895635 n=1 Tax=Daktulosphaira vitifoliae TaxID=58002 RepID=UPI0021AA3873|nr:uncharacterized protein LOC126895635 [Daktulosphaira vitifoliae]